MPDPGSRSSQVQDPWEQTQWQEKEAVQLVGHWSLLQAGRGGAGFKMQAVLETKSGDIKRLQVVSVREVQWSDYLPGLVVPRDTASPESRSQRQTLHPQSGTWCLP